MQVRFKVSNKRKIDAEEICSVSILEHKEPIGLARIYPNRIEVWRGKQKLGIAISMDMAYVEATKAHHQEIQKMRKKRLEEMN